jgi:hypothetical protein
MLVIFSVSSIFFEGFEFLDSTGNGCAVFDGDFDFLYGNGEKPTSAFIDEPTLLKGKCSNGSSFVLKSATTVFCPVNGEQVNGERLNCGEDPGKSTS